MCGELGVREREGRRRGGLSAATQCSRRASLSSTTARTIFGCKKRTYGTVTFANINRSISAGCCHSGHWNLVCGRLASPAGDGPNPLISPFFNLLLYHAIELALQLHVGICILTNLAISAAVIDGCCIMSWHATSWTLDGVIRRFLSAFRAMSQFGIS